MRNGHFSPFVQLHSDTHLKSLVFQSVKLCFSVCWLPNVGSIIHERPPPPANFSFQPRASFTHLHTAVRLSGCSGSEEHSRKLMLSCFIGAHWTFQSWPSVKQFLYLELHSSKSPEQVCREVCWWLLACGWRNCYHLRHVCFIVSESTLPANIPAIAQA